MNATRRIISNVLSRDDAASVARSGSDAHVQQPEEAEAMSQPPRWALPTRPERAAAAPTRIDRADLAAMEVPGSTPDQLASWQEVPTALELETDLVVVGGGLGGVAAAIAAARRGVEVVVVEPTHMLGGQATGAAVSAMDLTTYYHRTLNEHGLWAEFVARMKQLYELELDHTLATARYRDDAFAPNIVVVERVLGEMLEEAGVRCVRNAPIESVDRGAASVLVRFRGARVRAALAVDATETGDLLRVAGVAYRIGNRLVPAAAATPSDLDEVAIQAVTLAAVVRRYDAGLPAWARLPEAPPDYRKYRLTISRSYPDSPGHQFVGINGFAGYRATPDLKNVESYSGLEWEKITKTTLNFHNDQPVSAAYLEDPEARAAGDRAAILRSLSVIYYLQEELGLPWGVADDDGFDHAPVEREIDKDLQPFADSIKHLPLAPYIRESRRLLGRTTVTGKDIFRRSHHQPARWDVDAIAIGTYPPDLHGGRKEENLEADLGEVLQDKPPVWREGPFPIPMGAIVPRDGGRILAAEKNISVSRIAAGAVRLHPTVFATGEAVGTLAAIAIQTDTPVHEVSTVAVQASLIRGGALLSPVQIQGVRSTEERFLPISIAVCRRLVDWTYVRPAGDPAPEPWVAVDLDEAERIGRSFLEAHAASFR
ncbi:FAD-dependent oxidoreductase [Agrococcus sp. 1P02AA]|uniref:FAD-dependent oxidoreductase n=1 Tax=Agrococcus sp. 1P02AA TaxID=3132259 RepID=UPI0039A47980